LLARFLHAPGGSDPETARGRDDITTESHGLRFCYISLPAHHRPVEFPLRWWQDAARHDWPGVDV
jgi:hypothetical protein